MNSDTHALLSSIRKPKRLSMAGATRSSLLGTSIRSSTISNHNTPNLLDSINSANGSAKRRSTLLSTPASVNKRRQSNPPSSSQQSQSSQPLIQPSYLKTDQRPLKDKNYQSLIQQEIYDFLSINKFELEMNHSLTSRTLKQPTQKDFVLIFQFLYNKIDPNYKFTKSIQTEVTTVLKILNYPYLDSINRSQITAVGGSNWSAILGMLYWLVKLNLSLLNFDEQELIGSADEFDKHFINYIMNSYRSFIDQNEDYSEYYQTLVNDFNKTNEKLIDEIEELTKTNETLLQEYNSLNNEFNELKNTELKSKALENDLVKFQNYLDTMNSRKTRWSEILSKIQLEINNCIDELSKINEEKQKIETVLNEKGYTINDINNLNSERDKLSKSIDLINDRLIDFNGKIDDKNIELNKNYQSLDNFIKQYNNLIYKIPSNYPHNFEIQLNTNILNNSNNLFRQQEIINRVLKDEKIELLKVKSQLNSKIHQDQDDAIKIQEESDLISEAISERQEEIDSLEAKLTANKSTYTEIYDTMIYDTNTYSMQIEKLERELRSIKINTNQGFIEIENRFQNLSIEFDELNHEIFKQRSYLHDRIQKIIEFTISFKINIQQNLEDLDILVTNEYENEQKRIQ